ncbi:MAG TPA: hypothetical protein VMS02_03200, partial [Solirubrobacteraceae bacterium]|nr:hypothetical protein [Solirubrobacteraceae bacterium]
MDDLILGLLALAFAAVVLTFALALAFAVLAATMVATTVWAFGAGLAAFARDFRTSVVQRGGARRTPRAPEPAFEIYVLHQVFADFRHAVEHAASVLGATRQRLGGFAQQYQSGPTMPVSIGAVGGGYVGTGVAGLLGMVTGLAVGA